MIQKSAWLLIAAGATSLPITAFASSHREAPFISTLPKTDATDFYLFNSYEAGRAGYVTMIASYQPFENPQGGPNYYNMDPNALYEISIDNTGGGKEAITFQFRFLTVNVGAAVMAGSKSIPVPLVNYGPIATASGTPSPAPQNVFETYTVTMVKGDRRTGAATPLTDATSGATTFTKPVDNIGAKSIPNYGVYAGNFIHTLVIPGCAQPAHVFVGQRQDGFVVNLGETFDLVNIKYPVTQLAPGGNGRNLAPNSLAGYNVTSIAMEVPAACLTAGGDPVIGGWTTASLPQSATLTATPTSPYSTGSVGPVTSGAVGAITTSGSYQQVSRLGMPLVNELVIGLPDKDRWNSSVPSGDGQFIDYVTNPSLPVLLQTLFGSAGVVAPNVYPRTDLATVFLTGIEGLNHPRTSSVPSEELRLNTSTAVTPIGSQNDLGVLGGDTSGYPNGRRPIDDVVDITLRVAMGVLLTPYSGSGDPDPASDASRQLGYTDGVEPNPANYLTRFPYLATPIAGSPTSTAD